MRRKANVKNEFETAFQIKAHMMMRLELAAKWSFSAEQSHCLICGVAGDIYAQRTSIYTGEDSLLMSKFFGVPALSSANFFFSFMQCFKNIGKKSAGPCPVADPLVGHRSDSNSSTD